MDQAYLYFDDKNEIFSVHGSAQHEYPLGALVFELLDLDLEVYLTHARIILEQFRNVEFSEKQTIPESLAHPDECVYYQVASFYHTMSEAIRKEAPALFDLLESFCLSACRKFQRQMDYYSHALRQIQLGGPNDTQLSADDLYRQLRHSGNLTITSELMENFCRTFPETPATMKQYIEDGIPDVSLCRTALMFLEDFISTLKNLIEAAEDFRTLVQATLVSDNGRPMREARGQAPGSLLASLAQNQDAVYSKYHQMENDIHIQTRLLTSGGSNRKSGISAAVFFASDNLPALIFLEYIQMCSANLSVAVCEHCGRLFVPFGKHAKYCDRVWDKTSGATCKDVAAKLAYAESLKSDRAKELYNKTRNRNQMRCSRAIGNAKMKKDYEVWRDHARLALAQYRRGEITWELYEEIITQSF